MLFVIIPIAVVVITFFYMWIWESEPGLGLATGLLLAVVSILILLLCSVFLAGPSGIEVGEVNTYEIHALVDNASYEGHISGNVFLISGYVDEKLEYRYMYKVEGKGYAFGSIEAEDCYLNTTSGTPTLEVRSWKYKNDFLQWAFGDPGIRSEYIFYLPEDAEIIDEFVVDFE